MERRRIVESSRAGEGGGEQRIIVESSRAGEESGEQENSGEQSGRCGERRAAK